MSCDRSDECEQNSTRACYGCSYKHLHKLKIREEDNPLKKHVKKKIRDDCFKFCSDPKRKKGTGGRYRMDKAVEDILIEASRVDTSFPKLKEIKKQKDKLLFKLGGRDFLAKCDVAFETEKGKRILIEVKGYGADTNSIYSAILAAKILKADKDFANSLFYYFSAEAREKMLGGSELKRRNLILWAEETGVIDGFYGIEDIGKLFDDIKAKTC